MDAFRAIGGRAAALFVLAALAAVPLSGQTTNVRVIKDGTVLRADASEDARAIVTLPLGAVVDVIATAPGGWLRVRAGKEGGFASRIGFLPIASVEPWNAPSPAGKGEASGQSAPAAFPRFGIFAAYGLTTPGLKDERGYFTGFNTSTAVDFGIRYFFPTPIPRKGRVYLGLSYFGSELAADSRPWDVAFDADGNPVTVRFQPLRVRTICLETGGATRLMGAGSFVYLGCGIGYQRNSFIAVAERRTPNGDLLESSQAELSDDEYPIRLKLGLVLGFSPRIGIQIELREDILFGGFVRNYVGISEPYAKGGLYGFNFGLHIGL